MTTAIDTNILLDVLIPGTAGGNDSQALLERAAAAGELVVCEIVYAEIAAHFQDDSLLQRFVRDPPACGSAGPVAVNPSTH